MSQWWRGRGRSYDSGTSDAGQKATASCSILMSMTGILLWIEYSLFSNAPNHFLFNRIKFFRAVSQKLELWSDCKTQRSTKKRCLCSVSCEAFFVPISPIFPPLSQWDSKWVLAGTAWKRSKEKKCENFAAAAFSWVWETCSHFLVLGPVLMPAGHSREIWGSTPSEESSHISGKREREKKAGSIALLSHWSRLPLILLWKSCFDSCQTACKQRPSLTLLLDHFLFFFFFLFSPRAGGLVKRLCVRGNCVVEKAKKKIK